MNCLCGIFKLGEGCRQSLSQWTGARARHREDCSALLNAAQKNDVWAVRELLARGVHPDSARSRRRLKTPLFLATEHGHALVVETLLKYGADPSVLNRDGAGAITQAAAAGRVDLIKIMRSYQPEAFKRAAVLALRNASLCADSKVLKALLRGGAPANLLVRISPPVLHFAAVSSAKCVQILLDWGADPNCTDLKGRTALHWAAWGDRADCVRVLLAAGASVDARTADGRQTWDEAHSRRVTNLLLSKSTPPSRQPAWGNCSQSSLPAQSKERLSSERSIEGAPQPLQRAVPSDPASPGAPSSQDSSPRPATGPFDETSPGAPSSQGAPACPAARPSGVTSPGISPSTNDASASAGTGPSDESLSTTSSSTVAEISGVTLQGTSSTSSAKISSNDATDVESE